MLEPITDAARIGVLVRRLERELRPLAPNQDDAEIGYQGGNTDPQPVNWGVDFWFTTSEEKTHFWIPFGLKFKRSGPLTMVVQVNPTTEGKFLKTAGLFARDPANGNIHFLHTGRVAGGRKGVSQSKFLRWYDGRSMHVRAPDGSMRELLRVGTLGSSHLKGDVLRYVRAVKEFKDKVTGKKPRTKSQVPGKPKAKSKAAIKARRKGLGYTPPSYGTSKAKRKPGNVKITRSHGEVVEGLAAWLEDQGRSKSEIFNDQMVDLGLYNKHGVTHVYEVKTALGTQAIYTAIGQLMIHSSGKRTIKRTMVLPKSRKRLHANWEATLHRLNIEVLRYRKIRKGTYEFS